MTGLTFDTAVKALLAVIILVGGGLMLAFTNVDTTFVVAVMSLTIGYYFDSARTVVNHAVNNITPEEHT
jgi:proteasome assembly chaperone (PAC2) family protein